MTAALFPHSRRRCGTAVSQRQGEETRSVRIVKRLRHYTHSHCRSRAIPAHAPRQGFNSAPSWSRHARRHHIAQSDRKARMGVIDRVVPAGRISVRSTSSRTANNASNRWSRATVPISVPTVPTKKNGLRHFCCNPLILLAEWTGLEPATPGVTGRYSNQLNYHSTRWRRCRIAPQVPPDLSNRSWRPLGDSNPCTDRERVVS